MIDLVAITLIIFATFIGAMGSVYMKKGAAMFSINLLAQIRNKELIMGIFLFVLSAALYIPALRISKLSIIYPITSLSYVWAIFFGKKFFGEKITRNKAVGILLVVAGIVLLTAF